MSRRKKAVHERPGAAAPQSPAAPAPEDGGSEEAARAVVVEETPSAGEALSEGAFSAPGDETDAPATEEVPAIAPIFVPRPLVSPPPPPPRTAWSGSPDLDPPDPARLLASRSVAWKAGALGANERPSVARLEVFGLDRHLGNNVPEHDPDTEETPPTAVPGAYSFDLEWDDDDEQEGDAIPAPAPAPAPAPEPKPEPEPEPEPEAAVSPLRAAEPVRVAAVSPTPAPAKGGGVPVWLVIVLVIAAVVVTAFVLR